MDTTPFGENPLNRMLRRYCLEVAQARILARIALEVGEDVPVRSSRASLPGDPSALRGLPAVGVRGGYGGAIRARFLTSTASAAPTAAKA